MKGVAFKEDIKSNYVKAIEGYREEILNTNAPESSYVNLAFLYWIISNDFGFYTYHKIPELLREEAAVKYNTLLESGQKKYPQSLEIEFWIKYFSHRDYSEEFTVEQCMDLINAPEFSYSLVPYFYLKLVGEDGFQQEINDLVKICKDEPTAKNQYIQSVIESFL